MNLYPHATTDNAYIGQTIAHLRRERNTEKTFIRHFSHATDDETAELVEQAHEALAAIDQAIDLTTDRWYADCQCPEIPSMGYGVISYAVSCNCKPPPEDYRLPAGYTAGCDADSDIPF